MEPVCQQHETQLSGKILNAGPATLPEVTHKNKYEPHLSTNHRYIGSKDNNCCHYQNIKVLKIHTMYIILVDWSISIHFLTKAMSCVLSCDGIKTISSLRGAAKAKPGELQLWGAMMKFQRYIFLLNTVISGCWMTSFDAFWWEPEDIYVLHIRRARLCCRTPQDVFNPDCLKHQNTACVLDAHELMWITKGRQVHENR